MSQRRPLAEINPGSNQDRARLARVRQRDPTFQFQQALGRVMPPPVPQDWDEEVEDEEVEEEEEDEEEEYSDTEPPTDSEEEEDDDDDDEDEDGIVDNMEVEDEVQHGADAHLVEEDNEELFFIDTDE